MKKILLSVIAVSMLLSNIAFATTTTVENSKLSSVAYHLDSTDPH